MQFTRPGSVLRLSVLSAFLWACAASQAVAEDVFLDVPRTHWAYEAIQEGLDAGVLSGCYGRCDFLGDNPINRFQMSIFVKRLLDYIDMTRPLNREGQAKVAEFQRRIRLLREDLSGTRESLERIEALRTRLGRRISDRSPTTGIR